MSAVALKDQEHIINKIQSIKTGIVDIEILTRTKYSDETPLKVQENVERLKKNIFDLDISITNYLVE